MNLPTVTTRWLLFDHLHVTNNTLDLFRFIIHIDTLHFALMKQGIFMKYLWLNCYSMLPLIV